MYLYNITFEGQFKKIKEAYDKGQLHIFSQTDCFIATLIGDYTGNWATGRGYDNDYGTQICTPLGWDEYKYINEALEENTGNFYTPEDIDTLEKTLFENYHKNGGLRDDATDEYIYNELALYKALGSTLILLAQIHNEKGEKVHSFQLKMRTLNQEA